MKIKNKNFPLLICLGCLALPAYGAELPDTFYIKMADIVYYEDISSMRESIHDSIENPKAYLIEDDIGVMIAVKNESKYITFYIILREYSYFNDFSDCEFERKDINQAGNEELIIYCQYSDGISRRGGGYSEYHSRILIWDIDSYNCLLDFQDMYKHEIWWYQTDPNIDDLDYNGERTITDSSRELECYEYNVELEKMQLTIQEDEDCPNEVFGKKYIYQLTKSGFVLDRIEE